MEVWAGGAARLRLGWGSICSWGELSYSGKPLSSLLSSVEAPQTWWPAACPTVSGFFQPLPRQQHPQPFLVSLCLGSSRSYSAMQKTCALKKNLDKKPHPMTFFSSVCSNKKDTSSAWSPWLLMSTLFLTLNWTYTALFLCICFKAEQTNFTYMTFKQLFTFLEAVWRQ